MPRDYVDKKIKDLTAQIEEAVKQYIEKTYPLPLPVPQPGESVPDPIAALIVRAIGRQAICVQRALLNDATVRQQIIEISARTGASPETIIDTAEQAFLDEGAKGVIEEWRKRLP